MTGGMFLQWEIIPRLSKLVLVVRNAGLHETVPTREGQGSLKLYRNSLAVSSRRGTGEELLELESEAFGDVSFEHTLPFEIRDLANHKVKIHTSGNKSAFMLEIFATFSVSCSVSPVNEGAVLEEIDEISKSSMCACSSCGSAVCKPLDGRPLLFDSVKSLPSTHWKELLDCWSCHKNEFGRFEGIKFVPREGEVFLGLDCSFLIGSVCCQIPFSDDNRLSCKCGSVVGYKNGGTLSLHRYAVRWNIPGKADFCRSIDQFFFLLFTEAMDSHASYRFSIPFGDSTLILCILSSDSIFGSSATKTDRALKVLYKICSSDSSDNSFERMDFEFPLVEKLVRRLDDCQFHADAGLGFDKLSFIWAT